MAADPSESPPPDASPSGDPAPDPPTPGAGGAPGSQRRDRKRRWRRRLVGLAFGCLLPLVLIELGVRLTWSVIVPPNERSLLDAESVSLGRALRVECLRSPGQWMRQRRARPGDLYQPDPERGMRMAPGVVVEHRLERVPPAGLSFTVRTDRHGLRGPDRDPPAPGTPVLLCVGDSMTFGQGVEDTAAWPAQLEGLLSSAGSPVRVHNGGMVWLGQREELDVVRDLVPVLRPDAILLQFTVANDAIDNLRWLDEPGPLREDPFALQDLNDHILLTTPLARWSRAYRLGIWRWGRHAIRYRYMMKPSSLDASTRLIEAMRALAHELAGRELPFAVILAPAVVQVQGGLREALLGTTRINQGVRARCEAAGIEVLDPLAGLRARAAAGEELFIPVDRHWNPAGHRAVAEEALPLARRLLKLGS